jgi:hypothetical protein
MLWLASRFLELKSLCLRGFSPFSLMIGGGLEFPLLLVRNMIFHIMILGAPAAFWICRYKTNDVEHIYADN